MLGAQLLDLVGEFDQAAARGRAGFAGFLVGGVGRLLVGVDLLAQFEDGLAGFVVAKQGMGLQRPHGGQRERAQAQQSGGGTQAGDHGVQR